MQGEEKGLEASQAGVIYSQSLLYGAWAPTKMAVAFVKTRSKGDTGMSIKMLDDPVWQASYQDI